MSSETVWNGVKRRKGVNPITVSFREKAHPAKWRCIRCFRMDDTPDSWAVHQKLYFKGHGYVRHVTEWFPKAIFELIQKGYGPRRPDQAVLNLKRRGRLPGVPKKPLPVETQQCESRDAATALTKSPELITAPSAALPAPESNWAEENPALAVMAGVAEPQSPALPPKSPPPAINFVPDDENDDPPTQEQLQTATTSGLVAVTSKQGDIKAEMPGEYNPLAHPDKIAGELEDLVIFDEHVTANFLASQSRLKMMKLRAQQQRKQQPTPNNPIFTMAE